MGAWGYKALESDEGFRCSGVFTGVYGTAKGIQ